MPVIKIQHNLSGNNKGSSKKAIAYLEKEQKFKDQSLRKKESFFNQKGTNFTAEEAVKKLDSKRQGLGKNDSKYFSLIIAPSSKELSNLSDEDLKSYTKKFMELYADNFNKDINPDDLVWFAKLEHTRKYKGLKKKTKKNGEALPPGKKSGDFKPGDNRHIHILVRRKTEKNKKLSPMANARDSKKNFGKRTHIGFDRIKFYGKAENLMIYQIKSKNKDFKIKPEDTIAGRFLYANEFNYQRAIELGMNLKHIEQIKKIREKKAVILNPIKVAIEFHHNNNYPNKIKNISLYKGNKNALYIAFKKKFNIELSNEQLKEIHRKYKNLSSKKGKKI